MDTWPAFLLAIMLIPIIVVSLLLSLVPLTRMAKAVTCATFVTLLCTPIVIPIGIAVAIPLPISAVALLTLFHPLTASEMADLIAMNWQFHAVAAVVTPAIGFFLGWSVCHRLPFNREVSKRANG